MGFLWSGLLVLLGVLPDAIAIYVWSLRRRRPSGVRYSSLALIRDAQPGSSRLRRHLPFVLVVAALGALVLSMARPVVVLSVPTNKTTILLTIDVSGSMCSSDIPPSRLEAAEAAAASFINSQASTAQMGIVAFSSFAEVVQSPTTDRGRAAGRAPQPDDRTKDGASAAASSPPSMPSPRSIRQSPGARRTPTRESLRRQFRKGDYAPDIIVLLTDGANNTGPDPLSRGPAGCRPWRQGLHHRLRHGQTEAPSARHARRSSSDESRVAARLAVGSAVAAAGGGGGFRRGIDEATLKQIADHDWRDIPSGREREPARERLPGAPDEPDHGSPGGRGQRRLRGVRSLARGPGDVAGEGLAAAAVGRRRDGERGMAAEGLPFGPGWLRGARPRYAPRALERMV